MDEKKKVEEIEKLLRELKEAEDETGVTVEETDAGRRGFFDIGKLFVSIWKRSFILIAVFVLLAVIAIPFAFYYVITSKSTFTEQKGVYLEQIQDLKELSTAEAYTKVIIERQDNQLFGQDIGINLPGTKRQLLVVIPGSVKAGVDLSKVQESDMVIDEETKTATLQVPKPEFLGGAEIYFDQVEIYSYEGLFREKADISEAYELAAEAKKLIVEEARGLGVLEMAKQNAEKTLREMFSFAGYDVTIEFEE